MILYHGSNVAIAEIDLSASKPNKDFGRGFYLSADKKQAEEMAQRTTERNEWGTPTVTAFEFDESLLQLEHLKVKIFETYNEEWALFVVRNRFIRHGATHDFDIVIGPIADDRVGLQMLNYHNELIDLPTLVRKITYKGDIHPQYYFGTERAIRLLKHL